MRLSARTLAPIVTGLVVIAAVAGAAWVLREDEDAVPDGAPTARPSPDSSACPVDEAICEFAKRVEFEYREGDPRSLASPESEPHGGFGLLDAGIGGWYDAAYFPRVIGIGCSLEPGGGVCGKAFSLVLTAYPEDQQQERTHRVLIGFMRDGGLPIVTTNRLVGGAFNPLASGVDSGDCRLAGFVGDGACLGTRFVPYETGPAIARPAPAPRPTAVPGDALAGVDIVEAKPGMQSSIGYDTVVYYSTGCWGCGRPQIPNLYRAYRDSSGNLRSDDLFGPPLARTGGYPNSVAADWERGRIAVLICTAGYCGGEGDPSPDAGQRLFHSADGGVTFTEEPEAAPPIGAFLYGFAGDQLVVGVGERKGLDFVLRFFRYPSNEPLEPPGGLGKAEPVLDGKGGVVWRTYDPSNGAFDQAGKLIIPSGSERSLARLMRMEPGWLALWTRKHSPGYTFGLYDGRLELAGAFEHPQYADFRGQLPNGLLYGNVELAEPFGFGVDGGGDACKASQHIYPALVNWTTGSIHPIHELGDCVEGRHKFVNAMLSRPVVRVATGTDCLNVRKEPTTDSESLGCFADGVLLMQRVEGVSGQVAAWLQVLTPSLEPGWVSEEFVVR